MDLDELESLLENTHKDGVKMILFYISAAEQHDEAPVLHRVWDARGRLVEIIANADPVSQERILRLQRPENREAIVADAIGVMRRANKVQKERELGAIWMRMNGGVPAAPARGGIAPPPPLQY